MAEDNNTPEEKKTNKMILVVIIVIAVLAVAGIAVAKSQSEPEPEVPTIKDTTSQPHSHDGGPVHTD